MTEILLGWRAARALLCSPPVVTSTAGFSIWTSAFSFWVLGFTIFACGQLFLWVRKERLHPPPRGPGEEDCSPHRAPSLYFRSPCCPADSPASSPLPAKLEARRGFIPYFLSQEPGGGTAPPGLRQWLSFHLLSAGSGWGSLHQPFPCRWESSG